MSFESIPVRLNGDPRVDASWWNLPRTAGLASGGFVLYSFTHTQLQAAALTNDIELFSLKAKEMISGVIIKHSTAFAGTGITAYDLSVGITGDLTRYSSIFNSFQAIGDTVFSADFNSPAPENFGAVTSIRLSAVAVGANLDQSSAGEVDIWIRKTILP